MILLDIFFFLCSFIGLWISAELIIDGINRFSRRLNVSAFSASFLILGILTSIPELAVGISSVWDRSPEIFVGDLTGASFVLFLCVIPIMAIVGNGIKLSHQLSEKNLLLAMFVIISPFLFILNGHIDRKEGIFMILSYVLLMYFMEKRKGFFERIQDALTDRPKAGLLDFLKILVGAVIIFFSSKLLVDETIYFGGILHIPSFLIALVVLSLGTNLPEIVIGVKSVFKKQKDVAFGDYVGSAAANTLLFGVLVLVNGPFTIKADNFLVTFVLFFIGLLIFFDFTRSQRDISRREGWVLLVLYIIFLILQVVH